MTLIHLQPVRNVQTYYGKSLLKKKKKDTVKQHGEGYLCIALGDWGSQSITPAFHHQLHPIPSSEKDTLQSFKAQPTVKYLICIQPFAVLFHTNALSETTHLII